jgi:hypothetical protein
MPWTTGLVQCLAHIAKHTKHQVVMDRIETPMDMGRWNQACTILVNGKRVFLDTWDYDGPAACISQKHRIDLIVKIQAKPCWTKQDGIPVTGWSMFHTAQMNWLWKLEERRVDRAMIREIRPYRCGFTGRSWKMRRPWTGVCELVPHFDLETWPGRKRLHDTDAWVKRTHQWSCGLVLQGKHGGMTQGLNRREVEFASLGVPMILNYQPHYPDPMVSGVHYLYCAKPEWINSCIDKAINDGEYLVKNAREWWERNASVAGLCKSFCTLMEKYL